MRVKVDEGRIGAWGESQEPKYIHVPGPSKGCPMDYPTLPTIGFHCAPIWRVLVWNVCLHLGGLEMLSGSM